MTDAGGPDVRAMQDPHGKGLCGADAVYVAGEDEPRIVTGGNDKRICVRGATLAEDSLESEASDSEGAVLALAAHPAGTHVAAACADGFVRVYEHPACTFDRNATRFTLPARAVAFSPSGQFLACAGDDQGTRILEIPTGGDSAPKVFRELETQPFVAAVAYDPEGEFLAVAHADGGLQFWNIAQRRVVSSHRGACPKADAAAGKALRVSWHPDGSVLLAPGREAEVLVFERLSWGASDALPAKSLRGAVGVVAVSPNGLYVAAADRKGAVSIVNMATKEEVAALSGGAVVSSLTWHPTASALCVGDFDGGARVWTNPIPDGEPSPVEDVEGAGPAKAAAQATEGQAGTMADGEAAAADGDAGEDSDDDSDLGSMADFIDEDELDPRGRGARGKSKRSGGGAPGVSRRELLAVCPKPQEAAQPGQTPLEPDTRRRFLAFNLLGTVSTLQEDTYATVSVEFHDAIAFRTKPAPFTDYYGFHVADLAEHGSVFAARAKGDEQPAAVQYRPLDPWAPSADWTLHLPQGEEPVCVAAGGDFVAVATTARTLRVLSLGGLETATLSLPGEVVALAAQGDLLTAVFHGAPAGPDATQHLESRTFDVARAEQVSAGPLALTKGAKLTWLGYSEAGVLCTYDTAGVLRARSAEWGESYVPILDTRALRKTEKEHFFICGVTSENAVAVICKSASPEDLPRVYPPPVQQMLDLQVPLMAQPGLQAATDQRRAFAAVACGIAKAQAACGADAALVALQQLQTAQDRALLVLVKEALQGNRAALAFDIAARLSSTVAVEGAIKLAVHFKHELLANKLNTEVLGRDGSVEGAEEGAVVDGPRPKKRRLPPATAAAAQDVGGGSANPFSRKATRGA
ncbi:unnamed protein product [Pedinophyceae sp. YPF-701]|nr:unnamed protein product [Pedinophyceae sp. YPF-701]